MYYDVYYIIYFRYDRMFNVVGNEYSNVMGKIYDDFFRLD